MEKEERNIKIVEAYENGISMTELVDSYCLHRSTIQRILKKNGIKLKNICLPC